MFTYALSILLTSTAFVSTNIKIRHTYFEMHRILQILFLIILKVEVGCVELQGGEVTL